MFSDEYENTCVYVQVRDCVFVVASDYTCYEKIRVCVENWKRHEQRTLISPNFSTFCSRLVWSYVTIPRESQDPSEPCY